MNTIRIWNNKDRHYAWTLEEPKEDQPVLSCLFYGYVLKIDIDEEQIKQIDEDTKKYGYYQDLMKAAYAIF